MTTQISIRDDSTHAPPTVVVREARLSPHGRATNSESLGGVEGHAIRGLWPALATRRMGTAWAANPQRVLNQTHLAGFESCPRDLSPDSSRDGFDVSRRQLAADVIVRSIFIQRADSLRSNKVENPKVSALVAETDAEDVK